MFWYEAIVKYYDELANDQIKTDKVIIHSRDYNGAVAALVEDYGVQIHSFIIGMAVEGDWETYTCNTDAEERFAYLHDWTIDDLTISN